jgi:hypothetical protein
VVIGKRGNTYLRTQLINGARAALNQVEKKSAKVRVWAKQLKGRSSFNKPLQLWPTRWAGWPGQRCIISKITSPKKWQTSLYTGFLTQQ